MSRPEIVIGTRSADTADRALEWLASTSHDRIRTSDSVSWALSGGTTPILLYEQLAQGRGNIPWQSLSIFLVDERDVYAQDPLSNFGMLQTTLLDRLSTPPAKVTAWDTTQEAPETLARYRAALSTLPRHEGFPELDVVLLGMGADGHTASVFPGSPQQSSSDWVAYGPGPNASRYTLTLPLLTHARHVAFLVTGTAKASRVRECLRDADSPLPAAWLSRQARRVHWFLDAESASEL